MVTLPTLRTKTALVRIAKALREFAADQKWKKDEYHILFRVLEDWGRITVMLVAEDFGGRSDREMWDQVYDHLQNSWKEDGDIGFSVGLSIRQRGQVEKGGMYAIPESYVDVEDLLPASSLSD